MIDADVLRANARLKSVSGLCMNLAAAMIAADAYRIFVEARIDLTTALWTFVVATLIYSAMLLLGLLEAES